MAAGGRKAAAAASGSSSGWPPGVRRAGAGAAAASGPPGCLAEGAAGGARAARARRVGGGVKHVGHSRGLAVRARVWSRAMRAESSRVEQLEKEAKGRERRLLSPTQQTEASRNRERGAMDIKGWTRVRL